MIPYPDITEKADRRWTSPLLDRLVAPGLPDDELDDLVGALQAVSDPRSFGPLEAVLCNTERPARIRNAAGSHSCGSTFECSPLSCNHAAERTEVNEHCLLDDLGEAYRLAALFSRPEEGYEPGPYFVVEVWRRDAAAS